MSAALEDEGEVGSGSAERTSAPVVPGVLASRGRDPGLAERGDDEQPACVQPVCERASPGRADSEREPVGREQRRDDDAGPGLALHVHRQRRDGGRSPAAEAEHSGGDQPEVAAVGHGRSS